MTKRRVKRKRSKALTLLLLPALIFIGFIGWLMYTMGSSRQSKPKQRPNARSEKKDDQQVEDGVIFVPAATLDEEIKEDEEIIQ